MWLISKIKRIIAGGLFVICLPYTNLLFKDAFRLACFILLVDSVPFLIGLFWLRPPKPITLWKPAIYLVLIVAISALFSVAPTDLVNTFGWPCFILELAFFAAVNYYLWENLFKVTSYLLLEASILIGFVNAALCISNVPVIKGTLL